MNVSFTPKVNEDLKVEGKLEKDHYLNEFRFPRKGKKVLKMEKLIPK